MPVSNCGNGCKRLQWLRRRAQRRYAYAKQSGGNRQGHVEEESVVLKLRPPKTSRYMIGGLWTSVAFGRQHRLTAVWLWWLRGCA